MRQRAGSRSTAPPPLVVPLAAVFYAAMIAGAWLWLWLGDRLPILGVAAIGEHGIWAAAGLGLGAGLGGALALERLARRSGAVHRCERRIAALLGPLRDGQILQLSLLSAIAEELFFRLALQDALGLPAAVAIYAGLSTGPGFWAWAPIAAAAAALFGGLLQLGFGLLAATAAHAVINYLSLRRIMTP